MAFSFGSTTSAQKPGGFGIGSTGTNPPTQTPQPQTSGFSFGSSAPANTPQQGQTGRGLFGNTQQQQPGQTGGGLFGNTSQQQMQNKPAGGLFGTSAAGATGGFTTGSSTTATGGGIFGSNQQQQQQQVQPGQTGGGLFGSTSQQQAGQPGGGLFGSTQQQNKPAGGLFGGTNVAQQGTTGGLFGNVQQQNQPKPGGFGSFGTGTTGATGGFSAGLGFGQTQQQPQQHQQSAFGGFGVQNQQQQQQQMSQGMVQNAVGSHNLQTGMQQLHQAMMTLNAQVNPQSPECIFKFMFYNRRVEGDESYYQKPNEVDDSLWNQAVINNRDPSKYYPVAAVGFEGLQKRRALQDEAVKEYSKRLENIAKSLNDIKSRQDLDIQVRMEAYRLRQAELSHRMLVILAQLTALLRGPAPLTIEEEQMKSRLLATYRELNRPDQFKGLLADLQAQVSMQEQAAQTASKPKGGEMVADAQQIGVYVDYLKQQKEGIAYLQRILQEDMQLLETIEQTHNAGPQGQINGPARAHMVGM